MTTPDAGNHLARLKQQCDEHWDAKQTCDGCQHFMPEGDCRIERIQSEQPSKETD